MKISILLPDLRVGGAERVNVILANEFRSLGHDVEFVLMQARGELLAETKCAFSVVELGIERIRSLPIALSSYLREARPDALLASMWPLTVLAVLGRFLSRHRCRLLISEHGILSAQYGTWGRAHRIALRSSMALGYRAADARVGVSAGVVEDMGRLAALRKRKFCVIHNPIPVGKVPSDAELSAADAYWGAGTGARILTVGRFKAVKNQALLIRAFASLTDLSDARLIILGNGEDEDKLRAQAEQLGVTERVIFPGFQADPAPFYATADLFVLSSDYEGFGNVIVEAMAYGMPVVSTDCPSGPAEILENGRWGRLVPVGDADALARGIEAALSTPTDREALKRRAADFAPEIAARKYLDLLGLS